MIQNVPRKMNELIQMVQIFNEGTDSNDPWMMNEPIQIFLERNDPAGFNQKLQEIVSLIHISFYFVVLPISVSKWTMNNPYQ